MTRLSLSIYLRHALWINQYDCIYSGIFGVDLVVYGEGGRLPSGLRGHIVL